MKIPKNMSDEERQELFRQILTGKVTMVKPHMSKSEKGYHRVSQHVRSLQKSKPYKIVS